VINGNLLCQMCRLVSQVSQIYNIGQSSNLAAGRVVGMPFGLADPAGLA